MSCILIAILPPLILMCFFVPARIRQKMQLALMLKVSLSILFVLYALFAVYRLYQNGYLAAHTLLFALVVLGGMVFGLLGDIWLACKNLTKETRDFYLLSGFIFFLIGHLFYIVALVMTFAVTAAVWMLSLACALVVVCMVYLLEKPLQLEYGSYKAVILVYSFVIAVTTAMPIWLTVFNHNANRIVTLIFAIGMVLFLISDLVLSKLYFSKEGGKPHPLLYWANYLTYYGGQFTLVISLYFLGYLVI